MAFWKWFGGWMSASGDHAGWQDNIPQMPVIENAKNYMPDSALQLPVIWACVDLLARTMASLPCDVYIEDRFGTRERDNKCNLAYILQQSPNYGMTPYEFIHTMTMHWALRGNAYALIVRKTDKTVKALYPLNPDQMRVYLDDDGSLIYHYYNKKNEYVDYKPEQILHWKGMGNGVIGLAKLDFMKGSVTENALAQTTAVDIFGKKGRLDGILTAENKLDNSQKSEISKQFQRMRAGEGIPVLPASMNFIQLNQTAAESQLLETRKFSVEEICRWFGVPSALVNSDGGAPGSNLEQVTANFYKQTILPMCTSLEQAIMKRLPCPDERINHQVRFRLTFLNRASDQVRSQINAQAVQNGWKTRNEVRVEEGLAPLPEGDVLTAQSNLYPLEQLGQTNASQVPQTQLTEEPVRQ